MYSLHNTHIVYLEIWNCWNSSVFIYVSLDICLCRSSLHGFKIGAWQVGYRCMEGREGGRIAVFCVIILMGGEVFHGGL